VQRQRTAHGSSSSTTSHQDAATVAGASTGASSDLSRAAGAAFTSRGACSRRKIASTADTLPTADGNSTAAAICA
jgi:hypothetical protein